MLTRARLTTRLQPLLTTIADEAARDSGMVRRQGR
jgi:hypothetical protein